MSRFRDDRSGNFAVATALILPVLLGAAGLAVDFTSLVMMKTELQGVADAGALATASHLMEEKTTVEVAKKTALAFLSSQVRPFSRADAFGTNVEIASRRGSTDDQFEIDVEISYSMTLSPLAAFLGKHEATIKVQSSTNASRGIDHAISMFFVLDKSSSMKSSTTTVKSYEDACTYYTPPRAIEQGVQKPCYYQRIESLKIGATALASTFRTADPKEQFIRTGAVSFTEVAQKEEKISWGLGKTMYYVDNLQAKGSTSSSAAFKIALDALSGKGEDNIQFARNGKRTKKYIVFMTDGENIDPKDDDVTLGYCNDARGADITVYAVSFTSGTRSKNLLTKCAYSAQTFFEAKNGTDLARAFEAIGRQTGSMLPRLTR